jgi:hypothetical protein
MNIIIDIRKVKWVSLRFFYFNLTKWKALISMLDSHSKTGGVSNAF